MGFSLPRCLLAGTLCFLVEACVNAQESRPPSSEAELGYWLTNMVMYHRFSPAEVTQAAGLDPAFVQKKLSLMDIRPGAWARPNSDLVMLPYPGGRHPRIGFLDGAVNPQRETKISVFCPWDSSSYVVIDLPEAIWCQKGLLYLAHTHVPTIWTKQNVSLPKLEWKRTERGVLESERILPNKVAFGARAISGADGIRMELWLRNDSTETLSDLRVQNCVMLKAASGFEAQTNTNKVISSPFVACRSLEGDRWLITGWVPCHRPWANAPVPCLHSDPKFDDCAPGQTKYLRGWFSFYQGKNIDQEFQRLNKLDWLNRQKTD